MYLRSKLIFPSLTLFLTSLTFLLTSLTLSVSAQAPLQIPYQGVARDAQGAALQNQNITLLLSIEDISGTEFFSETHSTTTNQFGLFNVKIGSVSAMPSNLWSNGDRYLHVKMDPTGGSVFTDLGTTQFLSVPYALFAETSNTPGPQGPAGPAGANGIDGTNGQDGAQGPQGIQGEIGATGPAGTNGMNGQVGPQGPIGLTGAAGTNGATGAAGTNGATGPQGPIGLTGAAGTNGATGAAGATGPQGPIGLTGAAGTNGATGAAGATGPQGPIGQTGAAGTNGATGPQGPIGLTGAAGTNGATGAAGAAGATGPQGPIGLTGAAGTNGATGATGAAGTNGAAGAAGATGPQGPIGLTGAAGTNGATGPQGPIGLTGAAGTNGATGPQGPIGLTGAAGATGATGPQGPIGLTGPTGATGATGAAGDAGDAGASGKNTLVKTTTEAAGVNCATGGVKLEYGLDVNSNSVLDAGEITASLTKYVCNGAVGTTGATGTQGPIGLTGATGATGPQGPIGLTGTTGATGATGPQGPAGTNGQSAYEIWLAQGNTGTQQDFLNSLGNGENFGSSPTIMQNSNGNYSILTDFETPSFLRYFGNCSNGNKTCIQNEILLNESKFCNLTIPFGVTASINPAVRTIIYVKDTLFLLGTLNGSGLHTSVSTNNTTANHVGATASSFTYAPCFTGTVGPYGSGSSNFSLTWSANQSPSTIYSQFDGSINKFAGPGGCSECYGEEANGQDLLTSDLLTLLHFGCNISGGNGQATFVANSGGPLISLGGQGGAGLYILARCFVFTGSIVLNGGNGTLAVNTSTSVYNSSSAGGGGGSCIVSTSQILQGTGVFSSIGGNSGKCNKKGGNGAMCIISE